MIQLVIFDLDGVITTTTHAHFAAWAKLFKDHFNVEISPKLETLTRGVSREKSLQVLLDAYGIVLEEFQFTEMTTEKNETYLKMIEGFSKKDLLPGVLETLVFLKNKGIKLALASASRSGEMLLIKLGIHDLFDYIVDPTTVRGKPNPDIFTEAQNKFNLKPSECIGVEDAEAGIQAIKSAGMYALGIGSEKLALADRKVNSFTDLNELDWKGLLN